MQFSGYPERRHFFVIQLVHEPYTLLRYSIATRIYLPIIQFFIHQSLYYGVPAPSCRPYFLQIRTMVEMLSQRFRNPIFSYISTWLLHTTTVSSANMIRFGPPSSLLTLTRFISSSIKSMNKLKSIGTSDILVEGHYCIRKISSVYRLTILHYRMQI
ncbi:hypothetical protein EDEG_00282 [Edhazardia aedis USNM 41457]|uniref:Uncharacterized protein n=1 Tax=Edhazardia aedis (strain USNM 41457) TaxID=1003232 RepID=J9D3L2_EDHAE|nr:hypothetical protein EDEG_00282 [Edhazardia aedis USNM 41457]|eukprot:EJW02426.1 hypothetical protein EDEG_00282 [Edhazardia aedis USNM 41457]